MMNKHLLSNISLLDIKGDLKLADNLQYCCRLVSSVLLITTDGRELLHSIFFNDM